MTTPALTPEIPFTSISASDLWSGPRRMDAEQYLSGGYGLRLQIRQHTAATPFGELADVWMPGRLTAVAVSKEHGRPFLTATQAFDVRPIPRKFLAPGRIPKPETYEVAEGWLLVTRSGSVGDAILAYRPHSGMVMSDDLLRAIPREPTYRGFLYGFLRSPIGRAMLRSNQYGSIIKHLEPEHLREVPVPKVTDVEIDRWETYAARIVKLRDSAFALTSRAEATYAAAIGALALDAPSDCFETHASTMWTGRRRIDAFSHNPTAEAVSEVVRAAGSEPLGDLADRIFGVPRFKHIYSDHGTAYVDSEDLFKINPELTKFIPSVSEKAQATYFVEGDWLLMACSGQLYGLNGSTVLATEWHENKVVSNHVNRIIAKRSVRPEYLQMALGHPTLGRPLVLARAFGSEVPEIAAEDLSGVPVARLGETTETAIADDVLEATRLRLDADRQEDVLAAEVESAILLQIEGDARASNRT